MKRFMILAVIAAAIMPGASLGQTQNELAEMYAAFARLDSTVKAGRAADRTSVHSYTGTGAYTTAALGEAAQSMADRNAWAAAIAASGGNSETAQSSMLWKSYQKTRLSPEVRKAAANQFAATIMRSQTDRANMAAQIDALRRENAELKRDMGNMIAELETDLRQRIAELESELRTDIQAVAHDAALAANKKADWNKVRAPALRRLAAF